MVTLRHCTMEAKLVNVPITYNSVGTVLFCYCVHYILDRYV